MQADQLGHCFSNPVTTMVAQIRVVMVEKCLKVAKLWIYFEGKTKGSFYGLDMRYVIKRGTKNSSKGLAWAIPRMEFPTISMRKTT